MPPSLTQSSAGAYSYGFNPPIEDEEDGNDDGMVMTQGGGIGTPGKKEKGKRRKIGGEGKGVISRLLSDHLSASERAREYVNMFVHSEGVENEDDPRTGMNWIEFKVGEGGRGGEGGIQDEGGRDRQVPRG